MDEAGRGPLAGPVVAAAAELDRQLFNKSFPREFAGLNDSKKLSASRREFFYALIQEHPLVRVGVGIASVQDVAELNVLRATHLAMARAVAALDPLPDFALVDGLPVRGLPVPHRAIVGGDGASYSIAAASVVAKVTRDRLMVAMDAQYPAYGFARHKGYGTPEHLDALRRHGPCPEHRAAFAPISQLTLGF